MKLGDLVWRSALRNRAARDVELGGSAFNHLTEDATSGLLWIDTTGNEISGLLVSADNDYSTVYTEIDYGAIFVGPSDAESYAFQVRVLGETFPRLIVKGDGSMYWTDGTGVGDTALERVDIGVLAFEDVLEGGEIADPAAPAANKGRLYFKDVGGKTALVARFPTGAVQTVAVEP